MDFYFDTVGDCMQYLSLMKSKSGRPVSIPTLPNGPQMQASGSMRRPGNPQVPFYVMMDLSLLHGIKRLRVRRWGSKYQHLMLMSSGERLRTLGEYIEQGKLKTVVGRTTSLKDVNGVKELCQMVYSWKAGTGRIVIQIVEE